MLSRFPVIIDNICIPQTLDSRLTRRSANSCRKSSSVFFTEQSKLPAFAWNGTQHFGKVAASQVSSSCSRLPNVKHETRQLHNVRKRRVAFFRYRSFDVIKWSPSASSISVDQANSIFDCRTEWLDSALTSCEARKISVPTVH